MDQFSYWKAFVEDKATYFRRKYYNCCYRAITYRIETVTGREKLQKYFQKESVRDLIELLDAIAEKVDIKPIHFINRDPKDNFLLDLIDFSKADYLVTGDKDLLEHNPFKTAH